MILDPRILKNVYSCEVCQAAKHETNAYPGLLQPLPVPPEVWVDISIDLITGLPA